MILTRFTAASYSTRRMTIIDVYVVRLYFKWLAISFVSLTGLFIIVDAFNNLEEFIGYSKKLGGPFQMLFSYYGARTLWFFDRLAGIMGMIAAMLVVTFLQRNNEMTALMAAGISKARVIRPLLFAALGVSLLGVLNREFGLPQVRDKLTRNAQDWLGETQKECHPQYDPQTDILLTGKHVFAVDKRIAQPQFRLPQEMFAWGKFISADDAFFERGSGERPTGYRFVNVKQPDDFAALPSLKIGERRVLLSPADTPWLKPNEVFVASETEFDQLYVGNGWRSFLSTGELIYGLRNRTIENGADIQTALHSRFVQPFLDFTVLFLGLPLVALRENRNVIWTAGQCMGLTAAFLIVCIACHSLGSNYLLNPVTAVWMPMLIFAPTAYVMSMPLLD